MHRPRKKNIEKMSQPCITEYFSERKLRKRSLDGLKDNGKLKDSPIPKKTIVLDKNLKSTKETKTTCSNSSKLLISVLKKEAKSKRNNENKKLNFKVFTDPTIIDTQKDIPKPLQKIDLPSKNTEEKLLIKNNLISEKKINESFKDDVKAEEKMDTQQTPSVKIFKLEKNIETPTPKKLPKKEVLGNKSVKPNLPLPKDYEFLLKVFECIDSVAMMLYKRGSVITFKKLQPALRNMSTKSVTTDHLAQIHTIFPEAFSFKRKEMLEVNDKNEKVFQIILEPMFELSENISDANLQDIKKNRREKFYNALIERVKKEHEKFIKETSKSRSVIRKVDINCWHPNFNPEKCEPIQLSNLEVFQLTKIVSPKQVLEKVIECLKTESNSQTTETVENVSQTEEDANEDYRMLPDIAKIVRHIFLSEGKNVLTLDLLVQKLQLSYKVKITVVDLEKHVRLLCQFVPEWISLFNLGKADRLKFDKKIPFEKVQKILEALTKKK